MYGINIETLFNLANSFFFFSFSFFFSFFFLKIYQVALFYFIFKYENKKIYHVILVKILLHIILIQNHINLANFLPLVVEGPHLGSLTSINVKPYANIFKLKQYNLS